MNDERRPAKNAAANIADSDGTTVGSDRLRTASELGEYLGLTAGTILDRFERGDLPGYRLFGRKGGPVRFRAEEVEEWLRGCRVNERVA